jgi:peptidoglycan/LPS O-acetylase OafA/YrhL
VLGRARNAWLDSLRAFAILAVVCCHITSTFSQRHPSANSGWLAIAGIGGHGVDLFFVLSGWLLGSLLLEERRVTATIDVWRFWKRRWLRTLPAYYAVLLLTLGQRGFQRSWQVDDGFYFIFLQNYAFSELPFLGISWSLCIEEQFYLLIGPLLLLLPSRAMIASVLGLLVALPALARWWLADPTTCLTHLRLDACALGVFLAHLHLSFPKIWVRLQGAALWGILLGGGLILIMMTRRYHGFSGDLPLLVYALLSGLLVVQAQGGEFWRTRATHPLLEYVAVRSYSLYLVHIEALAIARRLPIESYLLFSIVCWVMSLMLAELLYRLVERPWMNYRDHRVWWKLAANQDAESLSPIDCSDRRLDSPRVPLAVSDATVFKEI